MGKIKEGTGNFDVLAEARTSLKGKATVSKKEIIKKLKNTLNEVGVKYSKIIMFGSRAKKSFNKDSDWDFLIILKNTPNPMIKRELWIKIYKRLHEYFPLISVDLILKDSLSFEREKDVVNTLSNEAYSDGIAV